MDNGNRDKVASLLPSLEEVRRAIELYPGCSLDNIEYDDVQHKWKFTCTFHVNLPSRARAAGQSESGVREKETVWFVFNHFPYSQTIIWIREDFNRDLAHINQSLPGETLVSPCIYTGKLSQRLHHFEDFTVILAQMYDWLYRAATNGLYDQDHGWEPVLSPNTGSVLFADTDLLANKVTSHANTQYFDVLYQMVRDNVCFFLTMHDAVSPEKVVDASDNVKNTYSLIFWPKEGVYSTKRNFDDISVFQDLLVFLKKSSLSGKIRKDVKNILKKVRAASNGKCARLDLLLVLVLRRPVNIADQSHNLEFLPFRLIIDPTDIHGIDNSPIERIEYLYLSNRNINARLNGLDAVVNKHLAIIGCGSLGSKLGLHLSKSGIGPFTLVDDSRMAPYNIARHGLSYLAIILRKQSESSLQNNTRPWGSRKISFKKYYSDIV